MPLTKQHQQCHWTQFNSTFHVSFQTLRVLPRKCDNNRRETHLSKRSGDFDLVFEHKKLALLTFLPRQNTSYVFNGRRGVVERTT